MGQLLVGPRRGDAKPGMDEQEPMAAQRGKKVERRDAFAAPCGQRGFGLQEERDVRTERRGDLVKLGRGERLAEQFSLFPYINGRLFEERIDPPSGQLHLPPRLKAQQ